MRSRLGHQYSSYYAQPLPTERRSQFVPYLFGAALICLSIGAVWWVAAGPSFGGFFASPDRPTDSDQVVTLDLAGQKFLVPQNHVRFADQRRGGEVDRIDVYALWPSMRGFTEAESEEFRDKGDDSQVIYVTLTAPQRLWRPAERFYQIYPYYFAGPEEPGLFGLMRRRMDEGSGLGDHDVYYHQGKDRFFLFHCLRDKSELMPSDCFADKIVEPNVLARFRFRRSMLEDWQAIDAGVEAMLARFAGR
jgi:hypothetical protein